MTDVTNILYWISTGLLIPTIALLLISFVRCLLLLGNFFGMFINRLKYQKVQQPLVDHLHKDLSKIGELQYTRGNRIFSMFLERLIEGKDKLAVKEKVLADFEVFAEKELSTSKSLSKVGPMLGLMGTLATTVVGIFVGGVGYITQLVKQRWFVEDLNNLEFISKLIK